MDVPFLGITFTFLTVLPFQDDDEKVEDPVEDPGRQRDPKLQLKKISGINHLKAGLSPNFFPRTLSGSLLLHTFIFFVMCLLVQNCEGHEVNSADATPIADPSSSPDNTCRFYYYGFIVAVAVAVVFFLSTVWACYKRRVNDTHFKEEEKHSISALMKLKPKMEKLQDELLSQLEEVGTEKKENKERRQSVERKLDNETVGQKQELLREKEALLAFNNQLDEMKRLLEKVLMPTDELLMTLNKLKE